MPPPSEVGRNNNVYRANLIFTLITDTEPELAGLVSPLEVAAAVVVSLLSVAKVNCISAATKRMTMVCIMTV